MRGIKRLLGAVLTIAVLAVCALFPPMLARPQYGDGGTWVNDPYYSYPTIEVNTLADRALCYSMYTASELPYTKTGELEISERAADVLGELSQLLRLDYGEKETLLSSGVEYTLIEYGENGETMRLVEHYVEWLADWRNWMVIVMDADTGLPYHAYTSSEYLLDRRDYVEAGELPDNLEDLLARFGEITGLRLVDFWEVDAAENLFAAELSDGESSICYDINFLYARASLVDVKLTIRPV